MLGLLARNWWAFLIRGIAAIAFGILAFAWPEQTLQVLVILFGVYAIADGVTLLIALFAGNPIARRNSWFTALTGVLSIGAGVVALVWPDVTALALLYVVAVWAIVTGVLEMAAAIALRREIEGEFWVGLGGLISIAFGVLLIVFPGEGLLSLVWLVAIWAISFGVANLGLAWELRGLNKELQHQHSTSTAAGSLA
jgi:uncharacterized membrane protein HdeD (DUF308 family)